MFRRLLSGWIVAASLLVSWAFIGCNGGGPDAGNEADQNSSADKDHKHDEHGDHDHDHDDHDHDDHKHDDDDKK